jgi:chromosomal replication initiator protein
MTPPVADTVLDGFYGPQRRIGARTVAAPSLEAIQDAVCETFHITRDELLSSSRAARLVWPRQVAMYLARENTDLTFPDIARRFGGRNHTTVMHAVKRAADRLTTDPEAFETVRELTERLSARPRPTGLTDSVPHLSPEMCASCPQLPAESRTCAHLHSR